ncbi:MAG: glycosyltransferase [Elusimicrobia bacterium]|nr:glycosyltransferase [Elusimicrobiota bacterium]
MTSPSARVLVVLPAWWTQWPPAQAAWAAALVRELASRWGAVTAYDPGIPGDSRGGVAFARRAWNDFLEQCKEAAFEHPLELVVAMGESAKVANLQMIAGWTPLVPRVSVFLDADWARLRGPEAQSVANLSDLMLMHGEWNTGRSGGFLTAFAKTPADACAGIEARFGLRWVQRAGAPEARQRALSVVLGPGEAGELLLAEIERALPGNREVIRVSAGGRHDRPSEVRRWNAAIRRAKREFVLLLDGRSLLASFGLSRLLEYFEMDRALAAVGATRLEAPAAAGPIPLLAAHSLAGRGHREHGRQLESSCWIARRGALVRTGLLDESFLRYSMAVRDYSFRLRQAGFRIMTASDVMAWSRPSTNARRAEAEDLARIQRKWCHGSVEALRTLLGAEGAR